jgi:hypothetical protein
MVLSLHHSVFVVPCSLFFLHHSVFTILYLLLIFRHVNTSDRLVKRPIQATYLFGWAIINHGMVLSLHHSLFVIPCSLFFLHHSVFTILYLLLIFRHVNTSDRLVKRPIQATYLFGWAIINHGMVLSLHHSLFVIRIHSTNPIVTYWIEQRNFAVAVGLSHLFYDR